MNQQPYFSIRANGNEVTKSLKDRIVEVSVTQRTGLLSDVCMVRFDNLEELPIQLPKPGNVLEIALGYKDGTPDTHAALTPVGKFDVGAYELTGPARALALYGNSIMWDADFKSPRFRSWPQQGSETPVTLGDLVAQIAAEYGLQSGVSEALQSITLPHLEQSESDMQLLTRLAQRYDAVMKVAAGKLLFVTQGTGQSLSGQTVTSATLGKHQIIHWSRESIHYHLVGAVQSYYHDPELAQRVVVQAGRGAPVITLPYLYPDEASAQAAATSQLTRLKRTHGAVRLTVPGNPDIVAGALITVDKSVDHLEGTWFITEVTHQLSSTGYISQIKAVQPN
ncbi:contractile injection system protein, VgrG/Pvc8 family [Pseudoalteromonas sp. OOF1S-7]|uniref:phage late control D family protein n=1 Tax=Pseudoalteromonas sp. OOF1S-7 TaxID=2917757 RepID=UPI001EF4D37D|nr:contractile injection system protein, VgrG/Pvc8 family [Pseudoalteromonas sp. OOF1S-7]MCG7536476.1 phage tail protein [Pseudoalteromonas sp. OOF1S-7]